MFRKILIANRGEIAVRVIRACKEMGILTVSIFSEADREALHVSLADESYCIGGARAIDSYMNMKAILCVAIATKSEAIHPGYGFLSENSEFARLCEENNIVFIGASSDIIKKMGDKDEARRSMAKAGVPIIVGSFILNDFRHAKEEAKKIGYPLLIKARSGGGGKGIRVVYSEKELKTNYENAVTEAKSIFGDGAVYLEKFLTKVKHIETQILADNYGKVICLGERDCSIQRKNQKLIEETPSVLLTKEAKKKMMELSVKAVKAVGYRGVGTLEFLYCDDGKFYFMEMNTRLQVEHPITEMVTWVDIVKWQIRIAAGIKIDFNKRDVLAKGHAIECRINAENPYQNFRPFHGKIETLHIPGGLWVRFDTSIYQNYQTSPYYDTLIGKLIVFAKTRDEAIRKMKAALCELIIDGIEHNTAFLADILSSEEFENGSYTIDFLSKWRIKDDI